MEVSATMPKTGVLRTKDLLSMVLCCETQMDSKVIATTALYLPTDFSWLTSGLYFTVTLLGSLTDFFLDLILDSSYL